MPYAYQVIAYANGKPRGVYGTYRTKERAEAVAAEARRRRVTPRVKRLRVAEDFVYSD